MRQPSERLWSSYLYYRYWKMHHRLTALTHNRTTSQEDFHLGVVWQIKLWEECLLNNNRDVRKCGYDDGMIKHVREGEMNLFSSSYYSMVYDALKQIPRENIFFINFHKYLSDPEETMLKIFAFLGVKVDRSVLDQNIKKDVNNRMLNIGTMWPKTRKLLDKFFEPFLQELVKLVGDDSFLFRNVPLGESSF